MLIWSSQWVSTRCSCRSPAPAARTRRSVRSHAARWAARHRTDAGLRSASYSRRTTPINALLALKALEKLGALVDWAKDGREALALAEAALSGLRPRYDLILMDVRMPGLDGHEATRRIRALERALGVGAPTRIMALTANALKENEAAARAAGLDGFLAKPFSFESLTALLGGSAWVAS